MSKFMDLINTDSDLKYVEVNGFKTDFKIKLSEIVNTVDKNKFQTIFESEAYVSRSGKTITIDNSNITDSDSSKFIGIINFEF